jgi:hypothetical protein
VIAYVYGNADLKKLNEATVLASRQAGQVNELERDRAHVDSVDQTEVVGVLVAPAANPNELLLTAGDCMEGCLAFAGRFDGGSCWTSFATVAETYE